MPVTRSPRAISLSAAITGSQRTPQHLQAHQVHAGALLRRGAAEEYVVDDDARTGQATWVVPLAEPPTAT